MVVVTVAATAAVAVAVAVTVVVVVVVVVPADVRALLGWLFLFCGCHQLTGFKYSARISIIFRAGLPGLCGRIKLKHKSKRKKTSTNLWVAS